MDESAFSMEVRPRPAKVGLFRRLLSSVAGAGSTEYVLIIGACSLGGLIGFKNFGKALRSDLGKEAQLILGKETPSVAPPDLSKTPGGLKPFLDGFVPPGGFFPACGVKGCTQCSLPKPSDVASRSLALTLSGTTSNSNGAVDPRSSGCSGEPPQEPPVEDARTCEERKKGKSCDPTKWLQLGGSPGLGDCNVETDDGGFPYEFTVEAKAGRPSGPGCNVTRIRVDSDGQVTFCFKDLRLKVKRGYPRKPDVGEDYVSATPSSFCGPGSMEATYAPLGGDPPTSRIDLNRYALKKTPIERTELGVERPGEPRIVLVPATVSGEMRSGEDDTADFNRSREALAVQLLREEGYADSDIGSDPKKNPLKSKLAYIKNNYEKKGFTWHHADLVQGPDGRYYYKMVLVPSAIHDTSPHDGGSSWARNRGVVQDPDSFNPPWDAKADPPNTSAILTPGWPAGVSTEPPQECNKCP